jgi:phosphopantetheinyl transferase
MRSPEPLKSFKTQDYQGVWLPFNGDRMDLRTRIEGHLRLELSDENGFLEVLPDGPHWRGRDRLSLSYSHTEGMALLVFSRTVLLGVDLEKSDRTFELPPLKIARRYFHPDECLLLEQLAENPRSLRLEFLNLWLKKEALGKLNRKGLKESIHLQVNQIQEVRFEILPVIPLNHLAIVAVLKP